MHVLTRHDKFYELYVYKKISGSLRKISLLLLCIWICMYLLWVYLSALAV